jgi:hypothetical protein
MADAVSADADSVSTDGGTVSAYAGSVLTPVTSDLKPERFVRQEQNRDAAARRREDVRRRKQGRVVLRVVAERKWLDALKRTATEGGAQSIYRRTRQ